MKRPVRSLLALPLSVLLLLLSLASFAGAAYGQQEGGKFVTDTGIITLGPNQVLRMSATTGDGQVLGNLLLRVRFRQMGYIEQDNIYRVASQSTSAPLVLSADEGAFVDIPSSFTGGVFVGVRGVVLSNSRNVRVTALIIDVLTGKVVSYIDTTTVNAGAL